MKRLTWKVRLWHIRKLHTHFLRSFSEFRVLPIDCCKVWHSPLANSGWCIYVWWNRKLGWVSSACWWHLTPNPHITAPAISCGYQITQGTKLNCDTFHTPKVRVIPPSSTTTWDLWPRRSRATTKQCPIPTSANQSRRISWLMVTKATERSNKWLKSENLCVYLGCADLQQLLPIFSQCNI